MSRRSSAASTPAMKSVMLSPIRAHKDDSHIGKCFFEHFAGEFPDDCVITAHRDPHKCLAVGCGGIRACQICKLPNRERTEPPSSFRHNAPVCGIRANRKNVFLDGLLANHGNGLAHLGLGRTLSVAAACMIQMIQIHFRKRPALRGKKSTDSEGKPIPLPLHRLCTV